MKLTKYRLELISRLFTIKATILFLLSFFLMKKKWRSIWNFPGILYNGKLLWLRPQLQSALSRTLGFGWHKDKDSDQSQGGRIIHLTVNAGESQEQGSLVGCHLWSHTGSDTTEAT